MKIGDYMKTKRLNFQSVLTLIACGTSFVAMTGQAYTVELSPKSPRAQAALTLARESPAVPVAAPLARIRVKFRVAPAGSFATAAAEVRDSLAKATEARVQSSQEVAPGLATLTLDRPVSEIELSAAATRIAESPNVQSLAT
jgi:hypothetical protein